MSSLPVTSNAGPTFASVISAPTSTAEFPAFPNTSTFPIPAPIYKTPFLGGYSNYGTLGFTGAVGGLSTTTYPTTSYIGSGYPSTTGIGFNGASITRFPTTSYAGTGFSGLPVANGGLSVTRLPATSYVGTGFPGFPGAIGGLGATRYPATSFIGTGYPTTFTANEVLAAPPVQFLTAPPRQFIESAPCGPCVECAPAAPLLAPPPPLLLPAPTTFTLPPAPAPLPAPPSVVHIKDDSGPKISSLQAEIRRLERLLAATKETEAGLRGEIGDLQARLEVLGQKELQLQACDAEVQKLREQLLESQRRIVFLEGQRDEAHKHIAFLEDKLKAADAQIAQMAARLRQLEGEVAHLRSRLESKTELHSRTNIHETYKVKTFEMAAKLAVMDGTDDGMYNGLPIEVEGEGLYRDLVAKGRRPRENVSLTGRPSSQTTTSETYKVQTFEMAEKLSKMDGTDDGKYNGLPIEVAGEGLYTDLVRRGRRSSGGVTSIGGGQVSSVAGGQTYKVSNLEMAAKISKMGGADDGTYKGLPIEVQGLGLYRDIRGRL